MGLRLESARPLHLLPFMVALLAALGWTGSQRSRRAADAQAGLRPPVARPSPAFSLCFEPEHIELGRLEPSEEREIRVSWRVDGDTPRRVLGVDATCGCVVATGLPAALAPADAGTLTLTVRAPQRPGPFHAALKVWLHPSPSVHPPTLVVRGHVLSPVGTRPARLDLGARTAGTRVERRVELSVTPSLAAAPVNVTLEGLAGSVVAAPTVFAGRPGRTLRLDVRVPEAPGPFAGRVVVCVDVAGETERVTLPVTGEAIRPVRR